MSDTAANGPNHDEGNRWEGEHRGRAAWARRAMLKAAGASALGAGLAVTGAGAAAARTVGNSDDAERKGAGIVRGKLQFPRYGRFTVVQFNDTQDSHRTDRRTPEFQRAVLEDVNPDFVVINGDVINGGPRSIREVKEAINNVVLPMEERGIPWALTFGNHDEDSTGETGFDEQDMTGFIRQYRHNLNVGGADVTGTSNQVIMIASGSASGSGSGSGSGTGTGTGSGSGTEDAFALWLLDSGRYAPDQIAGQDFEDIPDWDWLRFDQVEWYAQTSRDLEKRRGSAVPGLAFQHIALHEHRAMWFASIDSRTEADHDRAKKKHSITGERNEDECPGPFNSGMFNAMLHRGDIRGLYVGHDHINSYAGNYYGIELGYCPATGFGPHGFEGADKNRLRGARVFTLDEREEEVYTGTELKFARDYGIDMSAEAQPGEPSDFPNYVK